MTRAYWKGLFFNFNILNKLKSSKRIKNRSDFILPAYQGYRFFIYNGKNYNTINITKDMIGHKFGEFSLTRQPFNYKKKSIWGKK